MIDTDPREHLLGGAYEAPSLSELVETAEQLHLVNGYEEGRRGMRLQVVGQVFDLSPREAEMLLTGLLLGYFTTHDNDDVSSALWAD